MDVDIWGNGFKIATRQMSKLTPPYNLTIEEKVAIINNLVLNRNDTWDRTPIEPDGAALFTAQELMEAADKTPIKKATGSGGIFPETVMLTSKVVPLRNLDVLNRLLSQEFTLVWKKAMVTLIPKNVSADVSPSFRPICLLDSIGKLYERLIKERLESAINDGGGLNE